MMKFLAAAAVVSALFQSTTAQSCFDAVDGTPCKTSDGAPSRCYKRLCRDVPKLCPPGAAPLQACDDGGFCLSFLNPKELSCLPEKEVGWFMSYDSCVGKPDGAKCSNFYFEGSPTGSAALYDLEDGQCQAHSCMPSGITVCDKKDTGAPCAFQSVAGARMAEFRGTCNGYCDFKTVIYGDRATPRIAFDNRPGAKASGNVSVVDVCDQLDNGWPCVAGSPGSRCFDNACRAAPPTCPPSAKLLEKCSSGTSQGVCFGIGLVTGNATTAKSTLLCLDPKEIMDNHQHDACDGKKDGDACDDITYEVDSNTVYETVPGTCRRHLCMGAGIIACEDKPVASACTFRDVKGGDLVEFSGNCVKDPGMMATCDGRALSGRDTVAKAKVRAQGPEGDKPKSDEPSTTTPTWTPRTRLPVRTPSSIPPSRPTTDNNSTSSAPASVCSTFAVAVVTMLLGAVSLRDNGIVR